MMDDEQYWFAVDHVIDALPEDLHEVWLDTIVANWREDVAPEKHADYGIECWQRMGPRALVADISAVFYRYKRLAIQGKGRHTDAMYNVLIDSFGYAVLYTVCKYDKLFRNGWDGPTLEDLYDHEPIAYEEPVGLTNERILARGWDGTQLGYVETLAMRQAYNMWRGFPV